jgi:hypothetical protein
MAVTLQFKRGLKANLPVLNAGEPGFCTDTYEFFIGDGSNNHQVVMADLFDAGTFLYATDDNTPEAKTRAEVLSILSGTATSDFSMNSQKITDLAPPTASTDAVNKSYVDSVAQGLKVLTSVKVATTENITLSGEQTIDGVSVVAGDRVLVKDQTDATQNGIYVVSATAWSRAGDLDAGADAGGSFVFVEEGTTNGSTGWVCTNEPEADTVGTDALTFSQFSYASYIEAGTGLTKTGNTISVTGTLEDLSALSEVTAGQFIQGSGAGTFQYLSPAQVLSALSGTATSAFSMNSQRITNVADPVDDQDVATKFWVLNNTGSSTFLALTDTPSSYTANYVVKVNSGGTGLEFVDFATTWLEDTPTDSEMSKAPTSNWAYDHENATTGVHGAGANTLLHSGSTIDGGTF